MKDTNELKEWYMSPRMESAGVGDTVNASMGGKAESQDGFRES